MPEPRHYFAPTGRLSEILSATFMVHPLPESDLAWLVAVARAAHQNVEARMWYDGAPAGSGVEQEARQAERETHDVLRDIIVGRAKPDPLRPQPREGEEIARALVAFFRWVRWASVDPKCRACGGTGWIFLTGDPRSRGDRFCPTTPRERCACAVRRGATVGRAHG